MTSKIALDLKANDSLSIFLGLPLSIIPTVGGVPDLMAHSLDWLLLMELSMRCWMMKAYIAT